APLNIAGDEVLAALAAVAEQEVANVADRDEVCFLGNTRGRPFQDGADVRRNVAGERVHGPAWIDQVGVEEILGEIDGRPAGIADVGSVVIERVNPVIRHTGAEPDRGRGKRVGDPGSYVRLLAGEFGKGVGPS